ncbi:hypothetical protein LWC34_23145 [Kibdelosporangium philippinense]|uniref:Mce-associated membrane protein n=1 Tax=Kibdelosporangium philippinense TaxID=211113 RepID=A0ABS8ZCX2_9PSEU|nr:hypothetical protein [Kibdelosporangium philippinense]MCE7005699.1 hypothetical protein [Kibdelosporangium philippinense]
MTPPRRRPATPPARRPKVAGLHRRTDQPEQPEEVTPALDVPVIGEDAPAQDPVAEPAPRRKPSARTGKVAESRATLSGDLREATESDRMPSTQPGEAAAPDDAVPAESEHKAGADPSEALDGTAPSAATDPSPDQPQQLNLLIPAILVVVAVLLGGLGFFFMQQLSDARTGAGNDALSDTNTTKDVVGAANTAVVSVLSYKFDDMPAATARAKEYLAGEAVDQYDKSMKALETDIQTQKLQVVVNPVSVGVVSLSGDEARVLVFADQIGVREDKQPSGGPTQFAMNMQRVDGKWKIVKLDFFETPK